MPLPYTPDFKRSFLSHSGLLPLHPCLSTPGSLCSDSCVIESFGRRLARKRRQRPRQPSCMVARGYARFRTLNKLPRLAVSSSKHMTGRGRACKRVHTCGATCGTMPGWLTLQLPCACSVLAQHSFGVLSSSTKDSTVWGLRMVLSLWHLSLCAWCSATPAFHAYASTRVYLNTRTWTYLRIPPPSCPSDSRCATCGVVAIQRTMLWMHLMLF